MALIDFDGFDHYAATGTTNYIDNYNPTNWTCPGGHSTSFGVFATMPVLGGTALSTKGGINSSSLFCPAWKFITTPTAGQTTGFGFHYYRATTIGSDNYSALFGVMSGATTFIGCVAISSTGQLQWSATGPNQTKLGNSGANLLSPGTLYHIEVQILWNTGTSGSVDVRVNGTSWLSVTGINTRASTPAYIALQPYVLGSATSDNNLSYFKDFYVYDKTGTTNNNWLGERNIQTIYPSADTATAAWAKSTGTDGFDLINDVPPASSTRYLESSTVSDQSTFELGSLTNNNVVIIGVKTVVCAEKTDAGAGSIQLGVVSNGTSSLSSSTALTQSQYLYFSSINEVDPDTTAQWTPSAITALQATIVRSA